jgi:hypothetical protein
MKIELDLGTVTIDIPSAKLWYLTEAFFKID